MLLQNTSPLPQTDPQGTQHAPAWFGERIIAWFCPSPPSCSPQPVALDQSLLVLPADQRDFENREWQQSKAKGTQDTLPSCSLTRDHKLQGNDAFLPGSSSTARREGLAVGWQLCSAVAGGADRELFVPGFGGEGCHFLPCPEPCACSCCLRRNTRDDARGSLAEKTPLPDPESWLWFLVVPVSPLCQGRGAQGTSTAAAPAQKPLPVLAPIRLILPSPPG